MQIKNERIRAVISELSGDILGIYIIHLHVKAVVCRFISASSVIKQIVVIIAVFMISVAGISIARRIQIVKKMVT